MEVEGAVPDVQEHRGHDLAVVGQDEELGPERQDLRDRLRRPQSLRREDRGAELGGGVGDDRARLSLPATGRTAWRRDDTDEFDGRIVRQPAEGRKSETATPQEDGPHPRVLGGHAGHARALVASRTSASSSSLALTGISSSIDSR